MITSGFSLAFNGKSLLENSKEMLWQRNIYQVTTSTDGHGTMTASPMSGFSGTNVTLSNTPNASYILQNYNLTGATLTGDKFNLIDSDVTAMATFKNNYEIIYESNAETASTAIMHTIKTDIPNGYPYVAVRFDAKDGGGTYPNSMSRTFWTTHYSVYPALTNAFMGDPSWTPICTPNTNLAEEINQCEIVSEEVGYSTYIMYCRASDVPRTSYNTFNYVWGYKSTGYSAALNGIWRYRDDRVNWFTSFYKYEWSQTNNDNKVPLYTKNLRIGLFNNISDALSTAW